MSSKHLLDFDGTLRVVDRILDSLEQNVRGETAALALAIVMSGPPSVSAQSQSDLYGNTNEWAVPEKPHSQPVAQLDFKNNILVHESALDQYRAAEQAHRAQSCARRVQTRVDILKRNDERAFYS